MDKNISDKIDRFFTGYPKRSYPKGQILIFADETPEHIFYLTSGKVRCYDVSYRGDEVIVNIFKPPAFFPMSYAINRKPNQYFYKTEEPTELHIVPVEDALSFVKDNPDVAFDLLSRLYSGIDGLLARIVHLMSGTARSRLIYELLIECRRFGKKESGGKVLLTASEGDIAARAGLSRETVSREIHKLKQRGLVSIERGGIVLLDIPSLEKLHGSEV